jgi:hypothetical protein
VWTRHHVPREGEVIDDEIVVHEPEAVVVGAPGPRTWSLSQLVAVLLGAAFVVLGIAAVAKTGFSTEELARPRRMVWGLPHTPLLGAAEIAFGSLLVVAGVIPGAARAVLTVLGVGATVFGILVLADVAAARLDHWLAASDRVGALFLVAGIVTLVAAFFSPSLFGARRRRRIRHRSG